MKITKMTDEYLDEARTLSRNCFGHDTYFDTYSVIDGAEGWVVLDGDTVIAFALIQVMGEKAFLSLVAVQKEYRNQGLQKRLIRVRLKYAKACGCKEVVTYTARHNTPSTNALISCGFKVYEPEAPFGTEYATYLKKQL